MATEPTHLLPDPQRVRQRMSKRFSWIDHRALDRLQSSRASHPYGLYLALVLLGDRHGLSYYSDKSLSHRLRLDIRHLRDARSQLIDAGLIAYRCPFYQVLDLEPASHNQPPTPTPNLIPIPTPSGLPQPRSRKKHPTTDPQPTVDQTHPPDTQDLINQLRAMRDQLFADHSHP